MNQQKQIINSGSCRYVVNTSKEEKCKIKLTETKAMLDSWVRRDITHLESDAEFVGEGAFYYASTDTFPIESVSLPNATEIRNGAFLSCKRLKYVDAPNVSIIGVGAFNSCTALNELDFPNAASIGNGAFAGCTSLKTAYLKSATTIGDGMFLSCSIEKIVLSSLTTLGTSINNLGSVKLLDFTNIENIGSGALWNYSGLEALILRGSNVCAVAEQFAPSSGIESGSCYIYVPKNLIESYKASTNWSTYAAQFRALEDYTVDGTITGELDETKI